MMTRLSGNFVTHGAGWFGGGFGILWLLFWSAITCVFDGLWLWMLMTQASTWTYGQVEGTVLESRIEQGNDSDGDTTYDAKIAYEYSVQGQQHRGETIRNFAMRMNGGRRQAEESVRQFPVGKRITVYYHPSRPGQAVLERGFRGGDFFLPLFMTPFNIIMLGGWYSIVGSWRRRAQPAGIKVRDNGLKVTAGIYDVTPLAAAVVAVMASSFALIFVCGFGMMALPVDWLVPGAWCIVVSSAVVTWLRYREPATTVEYDHFSTRVSITKSDGQSHAFASSDVVALGREDVLDEPDGDDEVDDDDEDDEESTGEGPAPVVVPEEAPQIYGPTITYRNATGKEETVVLANWSSEDSVTWLVNWLQETLRIKS